MERKKIKELTEKEAEEILEFVYPEEDKWFQKLSFEPHETEDGKGEHITFNGRSIIGIEYVGGPNNDRCILHFDNTKVVLWLYNHGYEIGELLEGNKYHSEEIDDFSDMAFEVKCLSEGEDSFKDGYKQNWTLEYVKNKCKEILEKYYSKDYK